MLSVVNSATTSVKLEAPPRISTYLVYNRAVIVSWDDRVLEVDLVCPGLGVVEKLKIVRGVVVVGAICEDVVVVFSSYAIRPVRVVR